MEQYVSETLEPNYNLKIYLIGFSFYGLFLVSLMGWVVIALLVFSEVNNYLAPKPKEHMVVDTTLGQKLKININISFHALTCAEVSFGCLISVNRSSGAI